MGLILPAADIVDSVSRDFFSHVFIFICLFIVNSCILGLVLWEFSEARADSGFI